MAFSSNGQISYYVLDSLANGSKYGLEIIEHISKRTNGGYIMKKPTLYSCLTRMEKKGLVSSSYWGESELGGKRHYYSITNEGRAQLEELEKQIDDADFPQPERVEAPAEAVVEEKQEPAEEAEKPTYLQQDNLFDLVKPEQTQQETETDEENEVLENQIDIFNMEPISQPTLKQTEVEETKEDVEAQENTENHDKLEYYQSILEQGTKEESHDDAVLLDREERLELTPDQEKQNKRLYDTSSELKKYRKKKSFSENQIEMAVSYDKEEDDQIQRERIAELKRSLLNIRNNTPETEPEQETAPVFEALPETNEVDVEEETQQESVDDGRLITEPRINPAEIPVPHKIAPTNIEVNIYDDNLPAPKRNSDLEPTYKDMMAKLFERKTERKSPEPIQYKQTQQDQTQFVDYNSLKRYYQSRNIDFKEYKKVSVRRTYNTNFLQLIGSIVLLVLAGLASALSYWMISASNHLNPSTNFMFYTMPILFTLYALYFLTKWRCFASKKAALRYNGLTHWIIFLLSAVVIFIVNVACGMQFETIATYSTSLLLPALMVLLAFPVNFYVRKFLYKKYSR